MFYKKVIKQLGVTLSISALALSPVYGAETNLTSESAISSEINQTDYSPFDQNHFKYEIGSQPWNYLSVYIDSQDVAALGNVVSISNAEEILKVNRNYEILSAYDDGSICILLSCDYLDQQKVGELVLKVTFESGNSYDLYINLLPMNTVAQIRSLEDSYYPAHKDSGVSTSILFNHNEFLGMTMNDYTLIQDKDYGIGRTMDGMCIFFKKEFLDKLPFGKNEIVFNFDKTPSITYVINVLESPFESNDVTYHKDQSYETDYISINMNTEKTGRIVGIETYNKKLIEGVDYTAYDDHLELNIPYLDKQRPNSFTLNVSFESGQTHDLYVSILPILTKGEILPLEGTYDRSKDDNTISPVALVHGDQYLGFTMNGEKLVENRDYTLCITSADITVNFTDEFLKTLPLGKNEIAFRYQNAGTIIYTINVIDSTKANSTLNLDLENTMPVTSNTIGSNFNFTVSGDDSYDLSKLKIRYYYTADGTQEQNASVDNANMTYTEAPWYKGITDSVKAEIIPMEVTTNLADTYLELSFTGDEVLDKTGKLAINTRINKSDWSNYDQSNDCSYAPYHNVCVYYDGKLIIGDDPVTSEVRPD